MEKFQLILRSCETGVYHLTLRDDRWNLIVHNNHDQSSSIVVDGLVDSILLSGACLRFILKCQEAGMQIVKKLCARGGFVLMANSSPGMYETIKLQDRYDIQVTFISDATENVAIKLYAEQQTMELSSQDPQMAIVRLSVIGDWSGYDMEDLGDLEMQQMIYTEVL